jgi:AcrR family transcriptional regulator
MADLPAPPAPPRPPTPPTPPAAPPAPLTPERRREQTRQHLIDAAATVFAARGYHGASLDEVAAAAGFTKGAVYSNFKNKEDLFVAVLEERMRANIVAVEQVLGGGPTADAHMGEIADILHITEYDPGWGVLNLEFMLYAARNPAARELLVAEMRRTRDAVEQMVAREQELSGVRPDVAPRDFATIAIALFAGLDLQRVVDPEGVPLELMDAVLAFFAATARGMGADVHYDGRRSSGRGEGSGEGSG